MGKAEDEHSLPTTAIDARVRTPNAGNRHGCCLSCNSIKKLVSFRCVLFLVLGIGVILSAVFWLPIFYSGDPKDLDLDYRGHDIVATFMLRKPASFLQDYILQLEDAIFDEMSFTSTKVEIISLEPHGLNMTKVVFAVECSVTKILIRDALVALVLHQSPVSLGLFGEPFSFEVLKFGGGITVSPSPKGFLMQSAQIHFNFTLNSSIDEIINNFDELKRQLKAGLNLSLSENLYILLTNLKGSTVAAPTTVQSQVFSVVGVPSNSRVKQLAQTITNSHSKNLGLNNTVFGYVKQVRLSSVLQHSLGGSATGPSPSPSSSPSPSPLPRSNLHHHHHHHYHHGTSIAPNISPSPSKGYHRPGKHKGGSEAPAPVPAPDLGTNKPAPPPACHSGSNNRFPWKHHMHPPHMAPSAPPAHVPAASSPRPLHTHSPGHKLSPVPATSPRGATYAHSHPPTKGEIHSRPYDATYIGSPAPSPSSAGTFSFDIWAQLPLLLIAMLL